MLRIQVRKAASPAVICAPPTASTADAIRAMRENNISCVIISDGENKPLGIFTERDIVKLVASGEEDFEQLPVRKAMSAPVTTCSSEAFLYEALDLMGELGIRRLVTVDEAGRISGILTQSDIAGHIGYERLLEPKRVSQIMNAIVFTLGDEGTVGEALLEMADKNVSCCIVNRDRRPVGILTERDVARMAADRADLASMPLSRAMSSPVVTTSARTTVNDASLRMKRRGIRRLAVVDDKGRLKGLVTLSDIMKAIERDYVHSLKAIIREKDASLREAMRQLMEKTAYLDNILRSSMGMGIVATDVNLCIAYFNPAAEEILGEPALNCIGRHLRELHGRFCLDRACLEQGLALARDGLRHGFSFETGMGQDKRHIQAAVCATTDEKGGLVGYVLTLRDITDRKKAEETIRRMALYDALTDLPNRTLFNDRLGQELDRAMRKNSRFALVAIDFDHFKEINDSFGHYAGDYFLKTVAARFKSIIRACDTVARMGGDEFMMLLTGIAGSSDIFNAGARLLNIFKEPIRLDGADILIRASMGVAIFPDHSLDAHNLGVLADQAMYQAKKMGRRNNRSNFCLAANGCVISEAMETGPILAPLPANLESSLWLPEGSIAGSS